MSNMYHQMINLENLTSLINADSKKSFFWKIYNEFIIAGNRIKYAK